MAKYIDYHPEMKLSQDDLRQLAEDAKSGKRDQYGVRVLDIYYSPQGGSYCFLEAPDEEAIRRHNTASGMAAGEVREVKSLFDIGTTRLA